MRRAVIIGASNDRSKYENMALRAFRRAGYEVIPVNPTETVVEGEKAYATVTDVPGPVDTVTVYVRPAILVKMLPDIAAKGCGELWLNPGTASDTVRAEVKRLGLNAKEGCSILAIGQTPYYSEESS